jgi:hyperosmotically inducible periplasmic protein
MPPHIHTLALNAALLTAMALAVGGCSKTSDGGGTPPPTISVGTELNDSLMTSSVKAALIADPDIKSFDFKVETRKSEVMLSGFVNNEMQLNRALEIAGGVKGVVKVTNQMVVKK